MYYTIKVASSFQVAGEHIIYEDRTNSDAITCTDLTGSHKRVIYEKDNYGIYVDNHSIYYLAGDDYLYEVDYTGVERKRIKMGMSGMVYVFNDYDKIVYDDYGEVTEYDK